MMNIKDFKLIKNRQSPNFCYKYELKQPGKITSIFTMNGGKTFLVSIEEKRLDNSYYTEFSKTVNTIDEALAVL